MIKKKYTLRNAINHREFREYVQKMIRLIKDVDFNLL